MFHTNIMDALTAIFGSIAKVKLLRLFLFNPEVVFPMKDLVIRTKCRSKALSLEINVLVKSDIIKKRSGQKGIGYVLNQKFAYLEPLKNLLTVASIQADESLAKRFTGIGKIKLIIAAGVFTQNWDSRVDLLIVGDDLNINKIESIIKVIESEIGKEITYSAFETQDFEYRIGIHDRLVRDILDYPHIKLLDRIGML